MPRDLFAEQQKPQPRDLFAEPAESGGGTRSFGFGVGEGLTLGFGDELGGIVGGLIDSFGGPEGFLEAYRRNRNNIRATIAEAERANPGLFLTGELAGGATTALIPGGAVARGAGLASKIGRGAAGGAAFGGIAGTGAADELEDVPVDSGVGAAFGAGIGAAVTPVAAVAGKAIGAGVERFKSNRLAKELAQAIDVTPRAVARVSRATKADFEANPQLINELTNDDLLLNAGENLAGQASSLARTPGTASGIVAGAVRRQAAGEGARVKSAVNDILGPDTGRVATRKALKDEEVAAGRLFRLAKSSDLEHSLRDIDARVVEAAQRGEGPVGRALDEIAAFKVFNSVDKDGNFTGRATTEQVHAARQAIDTMLAKRTGDTSLEGQARRAVQAVRSEFDDILKSEVPGWRKADETFAIAKQKQTAFEDGRKALQSGLSPDEVVDAFTAMKPEVQKLYRAGFRDAISRIMGTNRNDATAASRELLDKNWGDEKVAAIAGAGPAKRLNRFLTRAKRRQTTKDKVINNSVTAKAQAGQREFPNPADAGRAFNEATSGGLTGIAAQTGRKVANAVTGGAFERRANRLNADAARLLTAQGPEARALIENMMAAQPGLSVQQAIEQIVNAGLVGGSVQRLEGQPLFAGTVRPVQPAR